MNRHLLIATKYRHNNIVRLIEGPIFVRGQLEGIGFYVDPELRTQNIKTTERSEGIDAWGALTAEEKFRAAESLIRSNVARVVPDLLARKP